MELEQQVCSLDLAKKLKELGCKQESYWYWWRPNHTTENWELTHLKHTAQFAKGNTCVETVRNISAFTTSELGEMLPREKIAWQGTTISGKYRLDEQDGGHTGACFIEDTEANARAKCLIWLIEEGHTDVRREK